jgi:dTDP-4-amino-4,6-dideoxygalactose transaminase
MNNIPFFDNLRQHDALRQELLAAADTVLSSGRLIFGPALEQFESEFATFTGAQHCIGVSSGTDALVVALKALGIGTNDEVITVANTAVPTVSAIRLVGAMPVFTDVDLNSGLMQATAVAAAVTPRTKAILPVHLYGTACDMDAIMTIANRHGLAVIEDCAQATGARVDGRHVGTFGHVGCFSFYPTKNLGAIGDAGGVVTSDTNLAEKMRRIRFYGFDASRESIEEGMNARMVDLQAAFLSVKLKRIPEWIAARRRIAQRYRDEIRNNEVGLPPALPSGHENAPHLFVVRSDSRNDVAAHLARHGVATAIHYPVPIHCMRGYSFLDIARGALPVTEQRAETILSLPLFPEMTDQEIESVIQAVNRFIM